VRPSGRGRSRTFGGELYANQGRIAILRASAAGVFSILRDTLFDDLLMAISRVTDRPKMGQRENLTLDRLSEYLRERGFAEAQREFDAILAQLRTDCVQIRELRNKALGHRDLPPAIEPGNSPSLVRAKEGGVALDHLAQALNVFERAVGKPTTMYPNFIHDAGPTRLLLQLKKALVYDAHLMSGRIKRGEDDLTLPPLKP
jgi:hypothetical protein